MAESLFTFRSSRLAMSWVSSAWSAALQPVSSVYVAVNEGFANWQSLWLCAACLVLALTLVRVRDAQN